MYFLYTVLVGYMDQISLFMWFYMHKHFFCCFLKRSHPIFQCQCGQKTKQSSFYINQLLSLELMFMAQDGAQDSFSKSSRDALEQPLCWGDEDAFILMVWNCNRQIPILCLFLAAQLHYADKIMAGSLRWDLVAHNA